MFCPRCAIDAPAGQRFCRNCGTNLGLILDAIDGKRGPKDFDSLKKDLKELGISLRAGFEEAKHGFQQGIKRTSRLQHPATVLADTQEPYKRQIQEQVESVVLQQGQAMQPIPVRLNRVRGGSTRKYSLAKATLGIFGGGASAGVLFYILQTAEQSGLLGSIERSILAAHPDLLGYTGIAATMKALWVLGLIPAVKGVAHLLNGILFAAKPEPEAKEIELSVPYSVKVTAFSKLVPTETPEPVVTQPRTPVTPSVPPERDTNEFYGEDQARQPVSVIEDDTVRFGAGKSPE